MSRTSFPSTKLRRFSPIAAFALSLILTSGPNNNGGWCHAFSSHPATSRIRTAGSASGTNTHRFMSSSVAAAVPTWDDLKSRVSETPVGTALDRDLELRASGRGGPNVHGKVRLFGGDDESSSSPTYTLFRDHAGWCPYCQKTMLLVEAKEIPINIELVNMRSYGDKPRSFLQKVPNGMLPALEDNTSGRVALDSAYIMEFLERAHPPSEGYKRMVPDANEQPDHHKRYQYLMGLERELFRWWCTLVFRQEPPNPKGGGGAGGLMGKLLGAVGGGAAGDDDVSYVSPSMRSFLGCLETVDAQLGSTDGPYFLDYSDHPTMIDFVFASHVERMLASCAYWKGMDLRNAGDYPSLPNLRSWMDALEKHEYYLAFQSDYYTHVKDIPPQYGPSSDGVSRFSKIAAYQADIDGTGSSWKLPLADDEALQPLYRGIPLPGCVLEASGISADADGSYTTAGPTDAMKLAATTMAIWKLSGNGPAVAKFAARGGPKGAKNVRKTFGAELADPYAKADDGLVGPTDAVLRVVAGTMLEACAGETPNTVPGAAAAAAVVEAAAGTRGVASSLAYLRDRIGVPRDLPLASARYLRAYLNWAIDVLEEQQRP